MTTAVCVRCGAIKWGSLNSCSKCDFTPTSERDRVMSVAISDHFLSRADLERASADIAAGGQGVEIDQDSYNKLRDSLREESKPKGFLSRMFGSSDKQIPQAPPPPAPKIAWGVNLAFVRDAPVILKGLRRSVEMEELILCVYLVKAREQGWSGGNGFFFIRDGKGSNVQLVDGMSIVGEDAKALGQAHLRYIATQSPEAKTTLSADFAALCQEGGFEIVTKETAEKSKAQAAHAQQNPFLAKLEQLVPDWASLNSDPGFLQYLTQRDKNTGKSFQELVAEAHGKNNVEEVAWFFSNYKELKAQQRNTCLAELERLVPDCQTINTDPGFFEYLKQLDKRTGKSYHELSAEALDKCNAADVAWFFNDYKKNKALNG